MRPWRTFLLDNWINKGWSSAGNSWARNGDISINTASEDLDVHEIPQDLSENEEMLILTSL